jgi:hypothetical protein
MINVSMGHLKPVDFDGAVLDYTKIDLHQILFVFEYFIAEMDPAAGHPCQGAAAQIEAIGVVGVGDVQQPLNGLLTQQIHGRRGDLVFGRIFSGHGSQAFGEGDRNDIDHEFKHLVHVTIHKARISFQI